MIKQYVFLFIHIWNIHIYLDILLFTYFSYIYIYIDREKERNRETIGSIKRPILPNSWWKRLRTIIDDDSDNKGGHGDAGESEILGASNHPYSGAEEKEALSINVVGETLF